LLASQLGLLLWADIWFWLQILRVDAPRTQPLQFLKQGGIQAGILYSLMFKVKYTTTMYYLITYTLTFLSF
jgi:hypothetical protein